MQNTANQRPPATCRVDHNKSADPPSVRRETRTRLSDPLSCQHRYLMTTALSGIVIDYCSVCRRGRPLSAMVCPARRRSLIRQERQQNIDNLLLHSKLRASPGQVLFGRNANTTEQQHEKLTTPRVVWSGLDDAGLTFFPWCDQGASMRSTAVGAAVTSKRTGDEAYTWELINC